MGLREKSYDLRMVFSGLELGKLSGISDMDKVNGSLDIEGTGFIPDSMNINTSLAIDSAGFRGYNYHDINAEVDGENGIFKFVLKSPDPLFKFDLTGMLSRNDSVNMAQISGLFDLDAGKLNLFRNLSLAELWKGTSFNHPGNLRCFSPLKNLEVSKTGDY